MFIGNCCEILLAQRDHYEATYDNPLYTLEVQSDFELILRKQKDIYELLHIV